MSAGLEAAVDHDLQHLAEEGGLTAEAVEASAHGGEAVHHISGLSAALTTNLALFILGIWVLVARHRRDRVMDVGYLAAVAALIAVSFTGAPVHLAAVVIVALVLLIVLRPGTSASHDPAALPGDRPPAAH